MGTPTRRRRRTTEAIGTRELILQEAMRVIGRDGVEDMMLKEIAEAVGIQVPSIYKHFAGREAILSALAVQLVEDLARFVDPDPDLAPRAWLEAWARGLALFFAGRPAYVLMILRDLATPGGFAPMGAALGPPAETHALGPIAGFVARFRAAYGRGVEDGSLRAVPHTVILPIAFGAVLVSLAWPYSANQRPFNAADIDQLQTLVASTVLGLAVKA